MVSWGGSVEPHDHHQYAAARHDHDLDYAPASHVHADHDHDHDYAAPDHTHDLHSVWAAIRGLSDDIQRLWTHIGNMPGGI